MEIVRSLAEMYTLPSIAVAVLRFVARGIRNGMLWPARQVRRVAAPRLLALRRLFAIAMLGGLVPGADAVAQSAARAPEARAEDVRTIDGIIRAFYETVSGPAGQPRQWQRDSTLYLPTHHFIATGGRAVAGRSRLHIMDHATFAAITDSLLTPGGFFESEVKRATQRFGSIAHVLSSYESRRAANGPVIDRGVNSIQLVWDGRRWWIASTAWDTERRDNPIPAELRF